MSIDIGQFVQVFLEEAHEHLATMESGLLGTYLAQPDVESLNAIFRAAHSIKGGAGTFGFGEIANFTHALETLLDRVRRGDIDLDEARVDACLRAVDILRRMLEGEQGGTAGCDGEARTLATELASLAATGSSCTHDSLAPSTNPAAPTHRLRVAIDIPGRVARDCEVMPRLLETLGAQGKLEVEQQPAGPCAPGSWAMILESAMGEDELCDFLGYVLAPEWVRIERHDPPGDDCDDEAYGFFEPLPLAVVSADAPFGLFEPLTGPESDATDDSYGFFEPLDPSETSSPLSAGGTAQPSADRRQAAADSPASAEDEPGYGFFDASPGAPTPPPVTAPADAAYGFFEPLDAQTTQSPQGQAVAATHDAAVAPTPAPQREADHTPASSPPKSAPAVAKQASSGTPPTSGETTSIRVGIHKVDQLINLVGELVITQSMLLQSAGSLDPVTHERLLGGLAQLERNTRDLQESVMSIRMVPMSVVFSRYPRMVRDLARKLGKSVELHLLGESTELDKGLIEKITDPLTHLIRNAVDHGLEQAQARVAAGKSATGHITLSAAHRSGHVLIEISDDGAGLNRERIVAKATKQGIAINPGAPDAEVWELIFAPGFSTAEAVTDVSGRGVGMDVVRKNILALGGSVHIDSATGHGTRVSIRLPLTLAILDGMSVRAGDEVFIVPLDSVIESLHAPTLEFRSIGRKGRVVRIRDDYVPVVSLAELLEIPGASRDTADAVLIVIEAEYRRIALAVDALIGQHQVVVKNLETNFRRINGISGATILGDGRVSLILDAGGLIRQTNPEESMSAEA